MKNLKLVFVLQITADDMYDFPRSHQVETESMRNTLGRRHCYNNAEPVNIEGHVFRYDVSPKPGTSTTVSCFVLTVSQKSLSSLLS